MHVSGTYSARSLRFIINEDRLILYYPVSALVTLFANILQNPQDTRCRSDLKLMSLVVEFLSMLCSDEENGSVRRMLNVCSEFERIAKVVFDKADKESSSRRKRKQQEDRTQMLGAEQLVSTPHTPQRSPANRNASIPLNGMNSLSPELAHQMGHQVSPPIHITHPISASVY